MSAVLGLLIPGFVFLGLEDLPENYEEAKDRTFLLFLIETVLAFFSLVKSSLI